MAGTTKSGGNETMSIAAPPPRRDTDGEVVDSIHVAVPSRPPHDSFSRRGPSPARSSASPVPVPRASSRRPSPLILPSSVPFVDFEGHDRDYERRTIKDDEGSRPPENPASSTLLSSSSSQLARKRSAPFDPDPRRPRQPRSSDEDDEDYHGEGFRHQSSEEEHKNAHVLGASPPGSAEMSQQDPVCLCLRAPKVPRPRNAFILYRQHYQSQVVADNPGLPNPNISKIIGQMWRGQSEENKNYWKQMAEQEKLNHRNRYPDYRFQPRRAGRGDAGGGRPGSAADSETGFDDGTGAGDGGAGGSRADPSRCLKCGGCYPASLPSARITPSSASHPPPSPFGVLRPGSLNGTDPNGDGNRAPFPSPRSQKLAGSQKESGRRPLPQHSRPSSMITGGRIQYQSEDHGDSFSPPTPPDQKRRRYDPPTPFVARFSPQGGADGNSTPHGHPSSRMPYHQQHYANANASPPMHLPPSSASLPQFPSPGPLQSPASPWMGPPSLPIRQQVRSYVPYQASHGQAYSGMHASQTPPVSARHAEAGPQMHASRGSQLPAPRTGNTDGGEGYGGVPTRLPPLQGPYGYYQVVGSGDSAIATPTPSTAMARLSMRPAPTPAMATPVSARPLASDGTSGGSRADGREQPPRHAASFADGSLKLPPLKATASPALHAADYQRPPDSAVNHGHPRPYYNSTGLAQSQSPATASGMPVSSGPNPTAANARANSALAFAVSPTPLYDGRHSGGADRDSQASGIRAMVMSVPYLSKLEVLRRISPPLPMTPRRGPIISIEGQSAALIKAVGRSVERALVQSGECCVGIWPTGASVVDKDKATADTASKKGCADSGVGSSIHGGASTAPADKVPSPVPGDASAPSTNNPFLDYIQLTVAWRTKSRAIVSYITAAGSGLAPNTAKPADMAAAVVPRGRNEKAAGMLSIAQGGPVTPASPVSVSPIASPAAMAAVGPGARTGTAAAAAAAGAGAVDRERNSGASANSSTSTSPRHSPYLPALSASSSASPSHPSHRLLPVALITGGFSLAMSDKFAMTVPIDDAYPPIGHWEWMATQWRGIASPDLVVYVDENPPLGRNDPAVNTRAHEGVIVVHAPAVGRQSDHGDGDGYSDSALDKKTERRLAFEVMEWIRSGNFGGA